MIMPPLTHKRTQHFDACLSCLEAKVKVFQSKENVIGLKNFKTVFALKLNIYLILFISIESHKAAIRGNNLPFDTNTFHC